MANTGYKGYSLLEQYTIETGVRTGLEKPNVASDPNYVAPTINLTDCPLPLATESYTATSTANPACNAGYSSSFTNVAGQATGNIPIAVGAERTAAIAALQAIAVTNAQNNANATCTLNVIYASIEVRNPTSPGPGPNFDFDATIYIVLKDGSGNPVSATNITVNYGIQNIPNDLYSVTFTGTEGIGGFKRIRYNGINYTWIVNYGSGYTPDN